MGETRVARLDRVMVITMDDPATRNALGPETYRDGMAALETAATDRDIGAVVLTGANGAFCSGGNLNRLTRLRGEPLEASYRGIDGLHGLIRAIRRLEKPVIAAVEGVAAGAGFSLALACDMIIASKETRFALAYVKVGLSPDGGATAFLSQVVTRQIATEIAMAGDPIPAARLAELGVINALCEPGTALAISMERARRLADGPAEATGSIKMLMEAAYGAELDAQLDREREAFVANLHRPNAGEGIAAFLEKRRPVFNKAVFNNESAQ